MCFYCDLEGDPHSQLSTLNSHPHRTSTCVRCGLVNENLCSLWGRSAANFITGLWGRPRTPVLFMRVLDHHTNSHRRHRPDSRHTRTPEMPAICTISLSPARAIDTMLSVRMPQRRSPHAQPSASWRSPERYQSSLSSVRDTLTRRRSHCTLHSTATSRCSSAAAPHPPPPPCLLLLRTTSSSLSPPPPRHHCHVITLDEPWPPSYLIRRALIPLSL